MFYLIVAILIVSYYFFMAPTSIRNTLNTIGLVGAMALLIVLAFMSFIKILQSPPEILLGFTMADFSPFVMSINYQLGQKKVNIQIKEIEFCSIFFSDGTRMIEKAFK